MPAVCRYIYKINTRHIYKAKRRAQKDLCILSSVLQIEYASPGASAIYIDQSWLYTSSLSLPLLSIYFRGEPAHTHRRFVLAPNIRKFARHESNQNCTASLSLSLYCKCVIYTRCVQYYVHASSPRLMRWRYYPLSYVWRSIRERSRYI